MDDIGGPLGLILSQLRFTRRAVEDIERSTARYGGFTFTSALAAGPKFGEPPIFDGALKVYVTNINDLAPGPGFLQSLFGGIMRVIFGVPASIITGIIGALALPRIVHHLSNALSTLERILVRLGIDKSKTEDPAQAVAKEGDKKEGDKADGKAQSTNVLSTMLEDLKSSLKPLTDLFTAAGGKGGDGLEPPPAKLVETLHTIEQIIAALKPVVDGLLIALPMLVGTLALVVAKFKGIEQGFLELIQFLARNVVLFRGVALAVIYDTVGSAAKLGGSVLAILGRMIAGLVESIVKVIGILVNVGLQALKFGADALQETVNALALWLKGPFLRLLAHIGDSDVFRTIIYVVRVLPRILPPLYEVVTGRRFDDEFGKGSGAKLLELDLPPAALPGDAVGEGMGGLDLVKAITAAQNKTDLKQSLDIAALGLTTQAERMAKQLKSGMQEVADEVTKAKKNADKDLKTDLEAVGKAATKVGEAMTPAQKAVDTGAPVLPAGLEPIAKAYEAWLSGGGLKTVLDTLTQYFSTREGAAGIPNEVAKRAATETTTTTHPTVEIDSVVIELAPPPPPAAPVKRSEAGAPPPAMPSVQELAAAVRVEMAKQQHELTIRGAQEATGPGSTLLQATV